MTESTKPSAESPSSDQQPQVGWRVKVGFAIFVASIGWPVLLPVLPLFGFSGTAVAAFTGVMVVAAEAMILVGAAIAGKEGFAYIKTRVFGFLKSYGPPKQVSRIRYVIGLVMFVLPLLLGWASPYLGHYLPGLKENPLIYALVGDGLLLISLFVLGGDFWDKLRSLFVRDAKAVFPEKPSAHGATH
jgi:hypothetical protein